MAGGIDGLWWLFEWPGVLTVLDGGVLGLVVNYLTSIQGKYGSSAA